jgi:hypothetical protein
MIPLTLALALVALASFAMTTMAKAKMVCDPTGCYVKHHRSHHRPQAPHSGADRAQPERDDRDRDRDDRDRHCTRVNGITVCDR